MSAPKWYPLPDEHAQMFGEAAMGLGRAAVALPLKALLAWLNTERATILRGERGVSGAGPRQLDQLMLIAAACETLAARTRGFDEILDEIERERAEQLNMTMDNTPPAPEPAAAEPAPAPTYGDRRDDPVPDDWAV
jgi:hypothetical protein